MRSIMTNLRFDFSGRTALVTGAGRGIGRAVALAFGAAGAAVVVSDIVPDKAWQTADKITTDGGKALDVDADTSNRFQMASVIERGRDAFGKIDFMVNAVQIHKAAPMDSLDEWDWRRIVDVNLTGAFFASQLVARVMADEGGGVIVNVNHAVDHLPSGVATIATNDAIVGLTRQAASELGARKIRVNAVSAYNIAESDLPANTDTVLGRLGNSDEVAQAVLFLCSDAAQYITGQVLVVNGGGVR
jgi:3-oxoacyl-[acyl-carrier protein] reductase